MGYLEGAAAVIGIISGIASLAKDLGSDGGDSKAILRKLDEILRKIDEAKQKIIDEIFELEQRDLAGTVDGLLITLKSYDPVGSDEPRLLNIIDNGAIVLGRLNAVLNDADNDSKRFESALVVYITLVWIRTLAMVERERRFHNPERKDLYPMFSDATRLLREGLKGIRKNSDKRFICHVTEGPTKMHIDTIEHGYSFDGVITWVASQIWEPIEKGIHESPSRAMTETKAACKEQQIVEYEKLPDKAFLEEEIERLRKFLSFDDKLVEKKLNSILASRGVGSGVQREQLED